MDKGSLYHRLNDKDALLSVFKDQVNILRPNDPCSAIGTYDLNGCSCLLVLGTAPGSAIVVARITFLGDSPADESDMSSRDPKFVSANDEHFMSLVRRLVSFTMSYPDLFQLPVVCGIFGQCRDRPVLEQLRDRTRRVCNHLGIEMHSFHYTTTDMHDAKQSSGQSTVVVVRHQAKNPELYIGNLLAWPAKASGCLDAVFEELGIDQVEQSEMDGSN